MATLRNLGTNEIRPVPARMLVGRGSVCSLRLAELHVSGEHASVVWTGSLWEIRDLGSRNGTFVDGERVAPNQPKTLRAGAKLGFGVPEAQWVVVDAGPPSALAEAIGTEEIRTAHGGILALPDEAHPEAVIYADRRGAWVMESDEGGVHTVRDQEVVQAGGRPWRIRVPGSQEGTATVEARPSIDTIALRFAVSLDEEHVEVTVLHRGAEIRLEPREHGYALLTLARNRLEDRAHPPSEQGWIDRDTLLRMLGLDSNALNVAIYRARGQLSASGVEGAAGLVEVRRGQRRIGLEPERLEVVRL
ncbi:MAG: FHA domain-containing protein [Deltaproteobacteria bacterium]|nr:FHA domain-containing protein [Deltaproteobacteria bacterium]